MALGTPVDFTKFKIEDANGYPALQSYVYPSSISATWQDMVSSGVNVDDPTNSSVAAPLINVVTQITRPTTIPLNRKGAGAFLKLALLYPSNISGTIVSPKVIVFGKTGNDFYDKILNINGEEIVELTINTAIDADNTGITSFKRTTSNNNIQVWDCSGYETMLVGIITALSGTNISGAKIQGRFF